MQAYSLDLRERVVATYENGVGTIDEVAEQFQVSESFIKKLLARKRTTGDISPRGHGGGQLKRVSAKERQWLLKTVIAEPDITLGELKGRFESEKTLSVSLSTICRELQGLNLRRKKSRFSPVSAVAGNGRGTGGG